MLTRSRIPWMKGRSSFLTADREPGWKLYLLKIIENSQCLKQAWWSFHESLKVFSVSCGQLGISIKSPRIRVSGKLRLWTERRSIYQLGVHDTQIHVCSISTKRLIKITIWFERLCIIFPTRYCHTKSVSVCFEGVLDKTVKMCMISPTRLSWKECLCFGKRSCGGSLITANVVVTMSPRSEFNESEHR